ncbi:MAG: hypothetical protein P8K77_09520 [Polaribacter sp.]|nr:hypothetical protein [Polaribacter sp.]
MDGYQNIEEKLQQFAKKLYTNELIKGGILFFSFGVLYFFFTLFVEYFLWLQPTARTLLFWVFISVELGLLFKLIFTPIFKLIGFKKGISLAESSKLIGKHFPEVKDKLLNVLQLKESGIQSDLLLASIAQKSKELRFVPFTKAINFKKNTRFLKYAMLPICIWLLVFITGNLDVFGSSLDRVVNYRTAYVPPAPFYFELQNSSLEVVQGKPITIQIQTKGSVAPSDAKIFYNTQSYYLQKNDSGFFTHTFQSIVEPISFYVEANGIVSKTYAINVIKTPTIQNISIDVKYPRYVGKKNEHIQNTGNILIPEGTQVIWQVHANQTNSVSFMYKNQKTNFKPISRDVFRFKKRILNTLNYQISTSNAALKDFEKLSFKIAVIKDEYPVIEVLSDSDSIFKKTVQFAGKISDDYGLKKLEVVYYNEAYPAIKQTKELPLKTKENQLFYFQFPGDLKVKEGVNYALFFQVFDTDAIHGSKKSKSKVFTHRRKTEEEVEQEVLEQQKHQISAIEKSLKNQQQQQSLEEIKKNLQSKRQVSWSDKKQLQNVIKQQEDYQKMMQRQTAKLQQNLEEQPKDLKTIQQKKKALKKRIKELQKLEKEQRLLEELKKLSEKLNKEDLLQKVKELAAKNKQQNRSLERVLELTKRFYVTQKTMQIATKLEALSKKQNAIQQQPTTDLTKQEEVKKEFKTIEKELNHVKNDNSALREPMSIPNLQLAQKETLKHLDRAAISTRQQQAKLSQQKAAQKMQEMSQKLQQAMLQTEGEMQEENKKSLRILLDNLLHFSFKQEDLMTAFSKIDISHPSFGKELKNQHALKTYFEHIDDSLYVLSMRLPEIAVKSQNDLASAHYNMDQSLENFTENRFRIARSNQQSVLTSVNNLAHFLSLVLEKMQQSKQSKSGKGKKGGKSFSLPDIIKKQGDLLKQLQEGLKKGNKKGGEKGKKAKGNGEELDGEQYQIYQEQAQLRQALQAAAQKGENGNGAAANILKSMEELENELLEKGFHLETLQRMKQLQYNLLKLEKAAFEQEEGIQRKSTENQQKQLNKNATIFIQKMFYNQTEILNRQSLPLQKNYKKKVRAYFSKATQKKEND